jgi:phosphoribosylamine--glycine ligase
LAAAVARSRHAPEVYVAPGNAGMGAVARCVDTPLDDLQGLARFARRENVQLTIAGSEEPLVHGAWNVFDAHGLRLFGPSAEAARLEGSKAWAKEFMRRHAIPTAAFSVHRDLDSARAAVRRQTMPCVVKADGLAAGKGVYIVHSHEEADRVLRATLVDGGLGDAGRRVVIEAVLSGPEVSVFAVTDGYNHRILGCAQDHKRAFDHDEGPNTGGMGAYSPLPLLDDDFVAAVESDILAPTLSGMLEEGVPYRGFLYLGLMLTKQGPQVLEYNCRLGDPEAQVLLPRIRSDVLDLLLAADAGDVTRAALEFDASAAVGVVIASEGYPGTPAKGRPIRGLAAARDAGAEVFCAGVALQGDALVTSGGRVVTVVGRGADVSAARTLAYRAVRAIDIPGAFHRSDIAHQALERETWQGRLSAS